MSFIRHADVRPLLVTGRFSPAEHPWTGEQTVDGTLTLPAAALLDMALAVADQIECDLVDDLIVHAQVRLEPDAAVAPPLRHRRDRGRPPADHPRARRGGRGLDQPRHGHAPRRAGAGGGGGGGRRARLHLAAAGRAGDRSRHRLRCDGFRGPATGPVYEGLRRVWRRGDHIYAEAQLPEELSTAGYGLHPVLLETALLPLNLDEDTVRLPSEWGRVRLHGSDARVLRIRLRRTADDTVEVQATDQAGSPVFSAGRVRFREADHTTAGPRAHADSLYHLDWLPSAATDEPVTWALLTGGPGVPGHEAQPDLASLLSGELPEYVVRPCPPAAGPDIAEEAHRAAREVLVLLQDWLAESRLDGTRLVLLTRGAVPVDGADTLELAASTVWGLVRSAQNEHPDSFVLVDAEEDVPSLLAARPSPPASRRSPSAGTACSCRVSRGPRTYRAGRSSNPDGTVLITGGTGTLGACWPAHLVTAHGVRHLLLAGRRGPEAPGAADLRAELTGPGRRGDRRRLRRRRPRRPRRTARRRPRRPPADRRWSTPPASSTTRRSPRSPRSGSTRCCAPRSTPPGTCTS